ncbi:hypothetical protein M011DRAFT_455237 [Sporormia fimetaria CBS 119925]|uniref:DRBM domain-containing protein n=1 Tax=Sporormia fimetaria CBS 119925 TaxID=1340428 RepID=A0A6A6VPQ2_9PLEO|nr:hypothetical protein M011DRAFT_455237 [Sporormia fimetaria CBS 119925]
MSPTTSSPVPGSSPQKPMHSRSSSTALIQNPDTVLSLDEYLSAHPLPSRADNSKFDASTPIPVPTPLSTRSSAAISSLHEKCQYFGVERPVFEYEEGKDGGWAVRMRFWGEEVVERGQFRSKREGKEAVCVRGLEMLVRKEERGEVGRTGRTRSVGQGQGESGGGEKEAMVNWVGMLQEFLTAEGAPKPIYQEYILSNRFSCTVKIADIPDPFGSQDQLFANKKTARQNAAKCAVDYYKAQAAWPATDASVPGTGIKKPKPKANVLAPSRAPGKENMAPGTRDSVSNGNGNGTTNDDDSNGQPQNDAMSSAARLTNIAKELQLGSPQFHLEPEASVDFWTVSCSFQGSGERIGIVRHVLGKKRAREECARAALPVLERILEERREQDARVLKLAGLKREE